MKSNEIKPGDEIIFDNGVESRTIIVTQQLIDNYDGEMPSEYSFKKQKFKDSLSPNKEINL